MAQVFEVYVERSRSAQPKDYESSYAKVCARATVENGDDWGAVVDDTLNRATESVYNTIGLPVPERAKKVTHVAPETTTPASAQDQSEDHKVSGFDGHTAQDIANMKVADVKTLISETGSDILQRLNQIDPRSTVQKAVATELSNRGIPIEDEPQGKTGDPRATTSEADDIPDDDSGAGGPQTAANTEADDIPDEKPSTEVSSAGAETSDIPDDGGTTAEADSGEDTREVTASELQQFFVNAIQHRGLSTERAREIVALFGVERSRDLKPEDRPVLIDKIEQELGPDV